MNKDFIKTGFFALFVSIVLLVAVFELKKFKGEEDVKEIKDRVVKVDPAKVNKIESAGFVLIRDRTKSTWRSILPLNDYMNFHGVEDWLSKALSFDGRLLSDPEEQVNWADFGINEESKKVTYYFEREQVDVSLSTKEAFDGSVYLKVKKNEGVFLYSSSAEWKKIFSKSPETFRSLKLFDWTVAEAPSLIKSLKIKNKNKEILSLVKSGSEEGEVWSSLKHPKWSIDSVKVDSFLSDVQSYLHKGFADGKMVLSSPRVNLYVEDQNKNPFSLNLYTKDKKNYAVSSYRPEHVLKIDKESFDDLAPFEIEFRALSDLIKDFDPERVKAAKIRIGDDNQVFRLKGDKWAKTDGEKIPKGYEFNEERLSQLFEGFKSINLKRYVPEKDVIFKSAKRKLYFYRDQKNIEWTLSMGQNILCKNQVKASNKCVLIATNKVQGYYGVALKSDVLKLFKIKFLTKAPKVKIKKEEPDELAK